MTVKVFTTKESTNQTQTETFLLPELKVLNSTTVNTGNVSIEKIDGSLVTVRVSSGSYTRKTQIDGSYTSSDSRTETDSIISSSNSGFPSTISYNSGGYKGTLSKNGSVESKVISGSYTPSEARTEGIVVTQTNQNFSSSVQYDRDGFKGLLAKKGSIQTIVVSGYPADKKMIHETLRGQWQQGIKELEPPYSMDYNKNGYTGNLRGGGDSFKWEEREWLGSGRPGDQYEYRYVATYSGYVSRPDTRVYEYTHNYSGIVVKPAVDTRVYTYIQRYSGTVTKPATDTRTYRYYYQYEVTFGYTQRGFSGLNVNINNQVRQVEKAWANIDGVLRELEIWIRIDDKLKEV